MDSVRRPPAPKSPPPSPNPLPPRSRQASLPDTEVALSPVEPRKPILPRWKWALLFFVSIVLLGLSLLIIQGFQTAAHIQIQNNTENVPLSLRQKFQSLKQTLLPFDRAPLRGEERGRINILLLGKADEDSPGKNLTDTLILMSIDTDQKRVALLSLPRDLWVPIENSSSYTKINALYQYGLSNGTGFKPIKDAVTLVTGEPVDYLFTVDFKGFESAIDAIGGINVDVVKDFYDPLYPGKNYSYETFELKKGWQKLDGATALKYARERHDDPEGDFGRAKRQQQVLQSVKNKVSSPGTFLNFFKLYDLFLALEKNVQTDVAPEEMRSFYELSKTLDTHNVTNVVYDAWKPESLLRVDHQILGGVRAFVLVPRVGNWNETRRVAENIFALQELEERRKTITDEEASLLIVHDGTNASEAYALARYLQRETGIQTTVAGSDILRNGAKQGMLWTRVGTEKVFSLDELLKILPVTKGDSSTQPDLTTVSDADFVLTMNSALETVFSHEESLSSDTDSKLTDEQELKH